MAAYIILIPIAPLLGFIILFCTLGNLNRSWVALVGVGSILLAAIITLLLGIEYLGGNIQPYNITLYQWMSVGAFKPQVSFYVDGLSLVMLFVITGVGLLIHIYSSLFMLEDKDYSRFFSYMNLFVAAMLVLVLADNLLLLFVGWEGVGLCSYLLVGFWHQEPANGAAARKAFIVTRIGDTAMILGLCLLFYSLGSLNIQTMLDTANSIWTPDSEVATLCCLLLVAGAVGKSAQLPLQTWLPDAMAGPTPVSALIHAATMVTAGVYLIARNHELFLLSPVALFVLACIGSATLLIAAFSAICQTDIKRILAYSTISQIGYMFLALGVGAWSASIFHLMAHAFFKALLFLAAGAVIYSLHHEHNIFKMGGLRKGLPVAFWSFMIGSAALSALPLTSGFYSKDAILLATFASTPLGALFWCVGLLGALLTAIYSFRLVFVVFFGAINTPPGKPAGYLMTLPLMMLALLAVIGGWFRVPVGDVFPEVIAEPHNTAIAIITPLVPIVGLFIAYLIYLRQTLNISPFTDSTVGQILNNFWLHHWGLDWLYDRLLVKPYVWLGHWNKHDLIDAFYTFIANSIVMLHRVSSRSQTGQLRSYALIMAVGLVISIAVALGVLSS